MVTLVLGAITLALLEAEHALPFRSWSCDFPGTVVSGAGPNRLPLVLDDIRVLSWRVDLAKYVLEADSRTLRRKHRHDLYLSALFPAPSP
jgi:hypothetical protein